MSGIARLIDPPPCPSCGRDAFELETTDHSVDLYIDPLTRFNVAARQYSYTIHPCGHEVSGFKYDASIGRVTEWSAGP